MTVVVGELNKLTSCKLILLNDSETTDNNKIE